MAAITPDELTVWSRYIHEICGIYLDQTKGYLLETRLGAVMREAGVAGFSELYYRAKADLSNSLRRKIVDAITTNETYFYREVYQLECLVRSILPELVKRRAARRSLRIERLAQLAAS